MRSNLLPYVFVFHLGICLDIGRGLREAVTSYVNHKYYSKQQNASTYGIILIEKT